MQLHLERFYADTMRTLGMLYVDHEFCCFTLEDPHQPIKVAGKTRIPMGHYKVEPRTVGKWPRKFAAKLPWHGPRSLEVVDVPGFTAILFHTGNTATDTSGCILVGNGVSFPNRLTSPWTAYERFARRVLPEIDRGDEVTLSILEEPFPRLTHGKRLV